MSDNAVILRVKGLPLTREAQEVDDQGRAVFYLNPDKVDWAESANRARSQIFPDFSLPAVDHKFDAIMRARREREASSK